MKRSLPNIIAAKNRSFLYGICHFTFCILIFDMTCSVSPVIPSKRSRRSCQNPSFECYFVQLYATLCNFLSFYVMFVRAFHRYFYLCFPSKTAFSAQKLRNCHFPLFFSRKTTLIGVFNKTGAKTWRNGHDGRDH